MKKAKIVVKEKKEEQKKVESISIKNSIIVVLSMLIVLVGFYFLTEKLIEKQNKEVNTVINVREINDINVSDIDEIISNSYYLMFSKKDDKNNNSYDSYINELARGNFEYSFYYVDMSKKANKDVYNEKEENLDNLKDIQVKDTTLVFVKDGKIEKTYVGSNEILKHLMSFFNIEISDDVTINNEDSKEDKDNEDKKEESDDEK